MELAYTSWARRWRIVARGIHAHAFTQAEFNASW
jgi:hypothetical protein